jgi:hypothetical protein
MGADPMSLAMYPGGPDFPTLTRPIIAEDDDLLRRIERERPETFAVEYRAQWASVMDAYLNADAVRDMFAPWAGRVLAQQHQGLGNVQYVAHGDPALNHDNFAFVIGHLEHDDDQRPHVVLDVTHVWRPEDYPDHTISHAQVRADIETNYLTRFPLTRVSFDQAIGPETLENLQQFVRNANLVWHIMIERTPTTAASKLECYESLKVALTERRVHAPTHELAHLELEFLQRVGTRIQAPTSGPVQTDDLADAIAHVVHHLLAVPDRGVDLATAPLGMYPGGMPLSDNDRDIFDRLGGTATTSPHALPRGYPGTRRSRGRQLRPGPRGRY